MKEADARLRILMLTASYLEICERRGWKFVETSPKAAIKHIISVLQAPGLKTRMIDSLQLERADLKNDYFGFMDLLSQEAEIFEEVKPLKKFWKAKPPNSSLPVRGQPSSRTVGTSKQDEKVISRSGISKTDRVNAPGNLPDCLNSKRSGKHYVKDCPIDGKELAKKLLADFREKQRQERKATSSISSYVYRTEPIPTEAASAKSHDDKSGVVSAEIGGHKFACRIDSGADRDGICDTTVSFLGDRGIFLPARFLSEPETLTAADGYKIVSRGKVQRSSSIETIAGPCRLRHSNVSIPEDKDTYIRPGHACSGEVILGNTFLVASGLNVKDFWATNLDRLAPIDYGSIETTTNPPTVRKLGMKLLRNEIYSGEDDVDPSRIGSMMSNGSFPLKDGDEIYYKDVEIGKQKDTELQEAMEDMVKRVSKNSEIELRYSLK